MTYFRRIYHPFMQRQPSLYTVSCGQIMLWTHTHPVISDTDRGVALLGAAVIIPALGHLAEAAAAVQTILTEQGLPR